MKQKSLLISIFLAGALVSFVGFHIYTAAHTIAKSTEVRANLDQYSYINPLLFIRTAKEDNTPYNSLAAQLESYIASKKSDRSAADISVYYRDMDTGRWTGVNEEETYIPGSMLKVYILMDYFQMAQPNRAILQKKILYATSTQSGTDFVSTHPLVIGTSYTVEELINHMIIDSDNESTYLLFNDLSDAFKKETMQELSLPVPDALGAELISPRNFSYMFRTLYNATFLSRSLSEQALELLTKTTYTDGLVAGVPHGVKVAHKFGEYITPTANGEERGLHDCGIVYYPKSPYFLCVMTRGTDFSALTSIISHISSMVYAAEPSLAK